MRRTRSGCCALAVSGHAAAPPKMAMSSRRLTDHLMDLSEAVYQTPTCRVSHRNVCKQSVSNVRLPSTLATRQNPQRFAARVQIEAHCQVRRNTDHSKYRIR